MAEAEEESKDKVIECESMPTLPANSETHLASAWNSSRHQPTKSKSGTVRHPSDPFKYKYMINRHEQLDIHCNLFDSSFVEYFLDSEEGNFDILFD